MMPTFVVFAGSVPGISLNAKGLLSSRPAQTVYGQSIIEITTNTGFIRLGESDEGLCPLVDWLNTHRHHDGRNELLAPEHILDLLKLGLEGAWDFPPESPCRVGPTSLFALIAGFVDVFISENQAVSEGGIGTIERWNQAFHDTSPEVFALHYAPLGARPKVDTVVQAFYRALTLIA
jgi:hypothetical protein